MKAASKAPERERIGRASTSVFANFQTVNRYFRDLPENHICNKGRNGKRVEFEGWKQKSQLDEVDNNPYPHLRFSELRSPVGLIAKLRRLIGPAVLSFPFLRCHQG